MSSPDLHLAEPAVSEAKTVRILVVDDHEQARRTICDLLRRERNFDVISEAANGFEAVQAAEKLQPEIVVLDITMPTLGGIEAAVRIRWTAPKARIVFLSQHKSKAVADAAFAAGRARLCNEIGCGNRSRCCDPGSGERREVCEQALIAKEWRFWRSLLKRLLLVAPKSRSSQRPRNPDPRCRQYHCTVSVKVAAGTFGTLALILYVPAAGGVV